MLGAENDEPEISFRRGYQQGAIDIFLAIERCIVCRQSILDSWLGNLRECLAHLV